MIQDMYNPEYYFEQYEVMNSETKEKYMKNGKYIDTAYCKVLWKVLQSYTGGLIIVMVGLCNEPKINLTFIYFKVSVWTFQTDLILGVVELFIS